MSSNDQSKNSTLTETEDASDDESTTERPAASTPELTNLKFLGPPKANRNLRSTASDFIQLSGSPQERNGPGPSNENKELRMLHAQQFKLFKSSEDLLLVSSPSNSVDSQNSPGCKKMSNNAFKSFLQVNFPSDLAVQNDESLLWAAKVLTWGTSVDKATQSTTSEEASLNDVFSRHVNTASQQTQITPSVVPPRPVQGDPPLQGAPPSYSAIMRVEQGTPRRIFGRRLGSQLEPSPPFISRSPPPTYAEAQGRFYRPLVSVDSELLWGPDPMPATCPRCGSLVITAITSERSNLTHFAALGLFLCGCWPCCLLPYCMTSCRNTYHYCPNCNSFLGVYRPW